MCKANNVIHNFYTQHHTIDKFDVEVQERRRMSSQPQTYSKPIIQTGIVDTIYDIRTVKIRYGSMYCKKQKLADICMPPYMDDEKYLLIIKELRKYFDCKKMSIITEYDNYVHLYCNGENVNTMINNMIVYYLMKK